MISRQLTKVIVRRGNLQNVHICYTPTYVQLLIHRRLKCTGGPVTGGPVQVLCRAWQSRGVVKNNHSAEFWRERVRAFGLRCHDIVTCEIVSRTPYTAYLVRAPSEQVKFCVPERHPHPDCQPSAAAQQKPGSQKQIVGSCICRFYDDVVQLSCTACGSRIAVRSHVRHSEHVPLRRPAVVTFETKASHEAMRGRYATSYSHSSCL